ncbi:MAG: EAL domain-containing protein [Gammaproteobacteria bacterium]
MQRQAHAQVTPGIPREQARESARTTPRELLENLVHRCRAQDTDRTALFVVSLNRSDRLQALAQDASNRPVLAEVARRVESMMRPDDRYALVANDELWLMLANLAVEYLVDLGGRTLRDSLLRPVRVPRSDGSEGAVQLRPVIGAAWTAQRTLADPLAMVAAASQACAGARVHAHHLLVCKLDDDRAQADRRQLEGELRAALRENALDVHFQPQIELASGKCVAAEALIRWNRNGDGAVSPSLIASICEEHGMSAQLTQFVLNNALRHQVAWASQGADLSVSINLSGATLADRAFPLLVSHALSTWKVPGNRLTLELTESAILQNEHAAVDFMKQVRDLGCRVAIDDFGTGYSSFAWLRQFPINELKIDRCFVRALDAGQGDVRTVMALINLAHTFGMRALAEGVESDAAARGLAAAGCDLAQGFRFSPAMPAAALADWCRRHREAVLLSRRSATREPR